MPGSLISPFFIGSILCLRELTCTLDSFILASRCFRMLEPIPGGAVFHPRPKVSWQPRRRKMGQLRGSKKTGKFASYSFPPFPTQIHSYLPNICSPQNTIQGFPFILWEQKCPHSLQVRSSGPTSHRFFFKAGNHDLLEEDDKSKSKEHSSLLGWSRGNQTAPQFCHQVEPLHPLIYFFRRQRIQQIFIL